MFGIAPGVGLTTSTLPSEVVQNIEDEEDELEESSSRLMHGRNKMKMVTKRRRC
jgi:hypothetical protein